jgi:HEAT repeat protein
MRCATKTGFKRLTLGLLAAALLVAAGCQRADWSDPTYITQQLREGNITEQKVGLKKLSDLSEEKQAEAVPAVVEVYESGNMNQEQAIELLVDLRVEEAKDAYMKELKENNAGYAGAAAAALGETGATDAIPDMLELYKSTRADDTRLAILRGFQHMPDKRMVDPLVETLDLSVDNHQIALHSYSCEILGDIAQDNPDAFEESAQRALVRARFLSNKTGQSVEKECSLAIQQLGEPAVPILVETFKGENEQVNQLLMKYRNDSAKYPPNRAKVGAIASLTAMRADKAVDLYLDDLDRERERPSTMPRKFLRSWWTKEAEALDKMILGVGDLGADKAKGLLGDVLTGKMNDKWSEVLDYQSEMQLRQDAAFALVRLGAREATDVMMKMAEGGVIKGLERRARALEQKEDMEPMSPVDRYQFNWMVAKAYSYLATGEELEAMKSLINAQPDEREELREKLKDFLPAIKLAKKCLAEDSADAKASCFGDAIDADKETKRKKAAWELMWLPQEAAAPVIVENLSTDDLGTREILEQALYRNPSEAAIDEIDKLLEEEADETSEGYQRDRNRLKLLRAWLENHFA